MNKAVEFSRNLRGADRSEVTGFTEGVVRYRKNGRYIDIAPDKRICHSVHWTSESPALLDGVSRR